LRGCRGQREGISIKNAGGNDCFATMRGLKHELLGSLDRRFVETVSSRRHHDGLRHPALSADVETQDDVSLESAFLRFFGVWGVLEVDDLRWNHRIDAGGACLGSLRPGWDRNGARRARWHRTMGRLAIVGRSIRSGALRCARMILRRRGARRSLGRCRRPATAAARLRVTRRLSEDTSNCQAGTGNAPHSGSSPIADHVSADVSRVESGSKQFATNERDSYPARASRGVATPCSPPRQGSNLSLGADRRSDHPRRSGGISGAPCSWFDAIGGPV
jgi:hypothetical protein